MDVADLPAGGRKEGIAVVPRGGSQFCQGGQGLVDGVAGQLWIGDVALDTAHAELATQGATTSILDHVTGFLDRGRFAHDAVIKLFTTRLELLDHDLGAVNGRTFLVTGQQKGQLDQRCGRGGQELLHRDHKGCDGGLHVARTPAIELAVLVGGHERVAAPLGQRPGGDDIGMACEYYCFDSV